MVATLSLVALIASLALVAWQGYLLRQQTTLAGAEVSDANLAPLHAVLAHLVQHPHLWPAFDKGARAAPGDDSARAEIIAEMLCDVVEAALDSRAVLKAIGNKSDLSGWPAYADYLLANSPVVRTTVLTHGDWYPEMRKLAHGSLA